VKKLVLGILLIAGFISTTVAAADLKIGVVSRSEERRVGKECRSRWWRYHVRKKRLRGEQVLVHLA